LGYESAPAAEEQAEPESCDAAPEEISVEDLPQKEHGPKVIYDEKTGGYSIVEYSEQSAETEAEGESHEHHAHAPVAGETIPETYFEEEVPATIYYDEATGGYAVIEDHVHHLHQPREDGEEPSSYVYYDE
jgi:hypothetical protein